MTPLIWGFSFFLKIGLAFKEGSTPHITILQVCPGGGTIREGY